MERFTGVNVGLIRERGFDEIQGNLTNPKMPPPLGPPQDPGHRPTVGSQGFALPCQ